MKKEVYKGLSFNEAYAAMRAGASIRRHGYKGYWEYNVDTESEFIHLPNGKVINYGKLSLTMKDCAATDWELVPTEDGTCIEYSARKSKFEGLTFDKAYKAMTEGYKVRRHNFKGYWAMDEETGDAYITLPKDNRSITYGKLDRTMRDCAATDWEIIQEVKEETTSPEAAQAND